MRKTLCILLIFALASCKKQVNTQHSDVCVLPAVSTEFTKRELKPPAATLTATATSPYSVVLSWRSRGNQTSDIFRDGVLIGTCRCSRYTDNTVQPNTTYIYRVGSLTAIVTTPGTVSGNVLFLDFDGHLVEGTTFNYSGPFYVSGAALTEAEQDSVLAGIRKGYAQYNLIVTRDSSVFEQASPTKRQRAIFTDTYEWYGAAGGVSIINSWGENDPCFIFSSLLLYRVDHLIFVGTHESGHTLGLYHAIEFCGQNYSTGAQWMGGNYNVTLDSRYWQDPGMHTLNCAMVSEVNVINNKLQ